MDSRQQTSLLSRVINFEFLPNVKNINDEFVRECKDQPLTLIESCYDSKPSLIIHHDALYLEAKWHGWIYYSYPVLRDQSLYYIFAELCANKMCRCVMDYHHHLKMISLAIERLILALRHSSINSDAQHLTETSGDCSSCVNTVPGCLFGCQMKKQNTQGSSICRGGNRGGERQTRSPRGLAPKEEVPTTDSPVKDY